MPSFPNGKLFNKNTTLSLILVGFLLLTISLTQYATRQTRDDRSQAASLSLTFSHSRPNSYWKMWGSACGSYDGHTYSGTTSGLSASVSYLSFCGGQTVYWSVQPVSSSYTAIRAWDQGLGTIKANADGSAAINWSWQYDMQIYPSNYASCSSAGSACKNFHNGADTSSTFQHTFTGLPANTSYKGDLCAPSCSYGSWADTGKSLGSTSPNPSVNLWADSTNLAYNTATTLRWTASNATSCTASNGWSGGKNASGGSEGTGNLTSSKTYTLTCSGVSGTDPDSDSVTIAVAAAPTLPPPSQTPPPSTTPPPPSGGTTPPSSPPSSSTNLIPTAPSPNGARLTPVGQQPSQPVSSSDITLKFAANTYLQGGMEVIAGIDGTTVSQKIVVDNKGGSFILKPGNLSKGGTYKLKVSSKNSLVQTITFKYVDSTSLDILELVTGDLNNDNIINETDLEKLNQNGFKSQDSLYDINFDAVVNSIDYSLLLRNLGKVGT